LQIKKHKPNTETAKTDAMFFAAHPDDAELNCGGTILSLVNSGRTVGIVDLTLGELSTRGNLKLRKKETDKATSLLGIKFRENLKISDGNIELNNSNKKKIIEVIRKYRPEIIFAPYPMDRHPDHINASNLIRESYFYSGLSKIKTGKSEQFRPSKIYYYRNAVDMPVSFIFDISKTFKQKLEVMQCYDSQFYNAESKEPQTFISSKLFEQEVEARARHFGFKIGVEFGEPFYTDSDLKIESDTLFSL